MPNSNFLYVSTPLEVALYTISTLDGLTSDALWPQNTMTTHYSGLIITFLPELVTTSHSCYVCFSLDNNDKQYNGTIQIL